jgi:hypothetical protein
LGDALREKRGRCDAVLKQLERTGEDQISLTDPDSRAMAARTKVDVGYNVQIAVDAKHKLIVDEEVTNQVVDGLLDLCTPQFAVGRAAKEWLTRPCWALS